jgi:S1-C subfamily serine protease
MDTERGSSAPQEEEGQQPGIAPGQQAAGAPGGAHQPRGAAPPPPAPHPAWAAAQGQGDAPAGYQGAAAGPGHGHGAWHQQQPGHGQGAPGNRAYGQGGPGYQAYGQGGSAYPGYGYQPGYGQGGSGYWPAYAAGTGEEGPDGKRRRRGLIMAAAGTALALVAGGSAWAVIGSGSAAPLSAAEIASKTNPGLVDVTSTIDYGAGTAEGTGMVLTSSGEVLTNNHVISGATAVKVRDIGNGRTYTAKVVGYSDTSDVAVLQLKGASGLSTVSIGSTSGLTSGQRVVALGNAEGRGGTPAVATGSITGLGAAITAQDEGTGALEHLSNMIRTNANIEPGDSGGPLLNAAGKVIGMDTAASTSNGGTGTTAAVSTTAFAIPIDRAISIADQIEAGNASSTVHVGETAFLGVAVSPQGQNGFGQSSAGATISGAVRGTPAAKAGLVAGDTITSVGGHQVAAASDLQGIIERYHPGDKVTVSWTDQAGQSHSATVTLVAGPAG